MSKLILLSVFAAMPFALFAQDDDMYYVPKKAAKASGVETAAQTYYVGSDRDVDEYNRHGAFRSSVVELEDNDIVDFDSVIGEYPDSLAADSADVAFDYYFDEPYDEDDYAYTRELYRWYDGYDPLYWGADGFYWRWRSPYYYGPWYGWWSPWYCGYWGWYSPWYWSRYSPWYWGSWGHYYYAHLGGHGYRPARWTNRGRGGVGNSLASSGRRSGNAYNRIAKNSSSAQKSNGVSSSRRSVGSSSRSYNSTRSTGSARSGQSYSSGSRSSFGGGGFSAGSRGGGGGGSRGGGGRR